MTKDQLRKLSIARSLIGFSSITKAIEHYGFVQADPIRAPARAQDLFLRLRVRNYFAGDLEKKYPRLKIEEDRFVNYGFMSRDLQRHFYPREHKGKLLIERQAPGLSERVLEFVRSRGVTHPKEAQVEFGKQIVGNYWGGGSQATTRALEGLHYRGFLRVAKRDNGIKLYEAATHLESVSAKIANRAEAISTLLHQILHIYSPIPESSLGYLISLSRYGAPHLASEIRSAFKAQKEHMRSTVVDGLRYYWLDERSREIKGERQVRFLSPFDPVVWDRRRFEHLHGWSYKFEAYVSPAKRAMGHYALPLLWGDRVIGWGNMKVENGRLISDIGYVQKKPASREFKIALGEELSRLEMFLRL